MASAYSQDLRDRVISSIESGDFARAEVAENLQVSVVFVDEVMHRYRETGNREALPWNGGRRRALGPYQAWIQDTISQIPDATLAELCARLKKDKKVKASLSMMSRELALLGLVLKKVNL